MTQEIATRDERQAVANYATDSMDRLSRWVEQARAVSEIAEGICSTSFAPAAYRGKPAEATAAILAGAELGFDPMASLRAFDSIQGVPAPKAITLRAVVQGAGHKVRIVRSSETEAVVAGLRRGDEEWQESVWTIERARKLGLLDKSKDPTRNPWLLQPAAMLVARATAEVCRWIASDAVMGMPYAAEEIEDQRVIEAPAVRRLTVADLHEPAVDEPAELITDQQRKHMFALWRELGYDGDANRETRLQITAKILGVETLESSNELTRAEASRVIDALIERKNQVGGEG